jgi:hypothetical protein
MQLKESHAKLSPRLVKSEEALRLGVSSGWYSIKVSGTFDESETDCLQSIAELEPPPVKKARIWRRSRNVALGPGSVKGFEPDRMVMLFSMEDGNGRLLALSAPRRWMFLNAV